MGINLSGLGNIINDKILKPTIGRLIGDFAQRLSGGDKEKEQEVIATLSSDEAKLEAQRILLEEMNNNQEHIYKMTKLEVEDVVSARSLASDDVNSDSWMSKNVRPISLGVLGLSYIILIFIMGAFPTMFILPAGVFESFTGVLNIIFMFYFGGRSFEKGTKIIKK